MMDMDPLAAAKQARGALLRAGAFLIANGFAFVVAAVHIDSHSRASWPLIATFGFIAALQLYYSVAGIVVGLQAKGTSTRWVAPVVGVLGALAAIGGGGMGLLVLDASRPPGRARPRLRRPPSCAIAAASKSARVRSDTCAALRFANSLRALRRGRGVKAAAGMKQTPADRLHLGRLRDRVGDPRLHRRRALGRDVERAHRRSACLVGTDARAASTERRHTRSRRAEEQDRRREGCTDRPRDRDRGRARGGHPSRDPTRRHRASRAPAPHAATEGPPVVSHLRGRARGALPLRERQRGGATHRFCDAAARRARALRRLRGARRRRPRRAGRRARWHSRLLRAHEGGRHAQLPHRVSLPRHEPLRLRAHQRHRRGARLPLQRRSGLRRYRFSARRFVAQQPAHERWCLAWRVEVLAPHRRHADRDRPAPAREPGPARVAHHVLRSGRALVLLLRGRGPRGGGGRDGRSTRSTTSCSAARSSRSTSCSRISSIRSTSCRRSPSLR